ncbi:MAG TPA: DUF58 domain-containing protein [Steroidobacteraceae bacterium]|nr:DUF58 domain-containing protein [Steroidobacteraceae bacterium]
MRIFRSRGQLETRLRGWALRRQGHDALPLRLTPRRVYILPTPAGWTFGLLVGVVFIAGMNYGNGLALLFAFWLAGFACVAMVQTQRSLAGTVLCSIGGTPAFAGELATWNLELAARTALGDLRIDFDGAPPPQADNPGLAATGNLQLRQQMSRRGRARLPILRITSTAPFGLFRTWSWVDLDASVLVYPRPLGTLPLPEAPGQETGSAQAEHGQDELAWLRDFREGDSPRQIAWKAYARGAPLLVREYRSATARRRELDFAALPGLDVEARLSQLARWIEDSAARGESWVLRLPGSEQLEGAGNEHREQCLARLALYGLPEQPA